MWPFVSDLLFTWISLAAVMKIVCEETREEAGRSVKRPMGSLDQDESSNDCESRVLDIFKAKSTGFID